MVSIRLKNRTNKYVTFKVYAVIEVTSDVPIKNTDFTEKITGLREIRPEDVHEIVVEVVKVEDEKSA